MARSEGKTLVTLEMLNDYLYLKKEIEELEKDIAKKEKELRKIIEEGTVIDSVSGGYGGTQHFRIEGIPTADIETRTVGWSRLSFLWACLFG